ncbi:MAG: four helix bundle protein [Phycisphaeraceae bacterium]|nr:four helix bundle protein [Phycisphaeraceae bacterium]
MGRLQDDFLILVETFCDRVLDVTEAAARARCPRRLIEQIAAAGTSVGANAFEAYEAMSRSDFAKSLAIVMKELNETRFWLRLVARRGWVAPGRLDPLLTEADELRRIVGTMISRTRQNTT